MMMLKGVLVIDRDDGSSVVRVLVLVNVVQCKMVCYIIY